MKYIALLHLALVISFSGLAQNGSSLKQAYIEQYKLMAIENMHRTGVPASITLAQGLLESGVGQSALAVEANNHFGIKCHKEWTGPTYTMDDDEKDECFRKYESALDSYLDHAAFLKSRPRYAELFKLEITDYKGWAHGLKAAGYATNPNYAPLLIKQIEELGLADFDRVNPTQLAALQGKQKDEKPAEVAETPSAPANIAQVPCQEGVFKYNKVKVVCAKAGDSPLSIAETYGLYPYQILKYNDLTEEVRFREGELVYIEGKRKRAQVDQHVVTEFESVRDLSQRYGISTSAIRRKNQLRAAEEFAAGETAYFVKKRADKPKVRSLAEIETLRSERDRKEAAKKANALEFINKLPDGFETLVGERGIKLSGGQRQRIALARAILKDAPVLILDEATSALDSETENKISEAITRLKGKSTIVVVAHRLSTVRKADTVLYLEDGCIIDSGTFDELKNKNANFQKQAEFMGL
jgi:ABC-type dipeptide/oligopeptide/nickel transport system ATPase subunit